MDVFLLFFLVCCYFFYTFCKTNPQDVPDIRRIKGTQSWFSRYQNQHLYVPVLYGLLAIKTRIQDPLIVYIDKMDGSIRVNTPTLADSINLLGGKAFFIAYRIVLASYFMPWGTLAVLLFIQDLVTSFYLALSFQVSHVVGEVDWPLPDEDGQITEDW